MIKKIKYLATAGLLLLTIPFLLIGIYMIAPTVTESLIKDLGAPDGATVISPLKNYWQEGTSPAMTIIGYTSPASRQEILDYYRSSCERLGLRTKPNADENFHGPDAICFGETLIEVKFDEDNLNERKYFIWASYLVL